MDRRRFLAGVGGSCFAVTSGCLAIDARETPMVLSLVSVDRGPEPLSFEIDLREETLTETRAPTLDIAVTNRGKKSAKWEYGGGVGNLPFPQRVYSADDRLVIGLEKEVESQLRDTSRGCARLEHFVAANGIQHTSLEPDETIRNRYAVAGIGGNFNGVCPEPTTYRMEEQLGDYGEWGFTIKLD
ncbi:hypothetical protein [Natrinema sp. 74]|uniref:hypothetical protein n=1 Tax=Natrinema sp. 74 TaxID=3384159 RepID=UPI0038D47771